MELRRLAVEAIGCATLAAAVLGARADLAPAGWPALDPSLAWPGAALLVATSVLGSFALRRRAPVDRALGSVLLGAVLAVAAVFLLRLDVNRSVLVPYVLGAPVVTLFAAWAAPVHTGPPADPAWPELDPARMAKRAVDLASATALLLVTAPLLLVVGASIARDGGPVFFAQERVGQGGRTFRMWKLRTMVVGAEDLLPALLPRSDVRGPAFKMRGDPRVTPIGAWLRRTSLDEWPQLWNVVRGEMSLVGPRPPLRVEVDALTSDQRRRLTVPQGMTGLWQVSGRADLPWERWIALDLEYVDAWSPWLDLRVLLRTPAAVWRGTGAR